MGFTELDKEDLKELFRVNNFSKINKVEEEVQAAEAKGQTPSALFDELYKVYRIATLEDRDGALQRLKDAVPSATTEEVLSVVRQTEIKGLKEKDAKRTLERKLGVKVMSNPQARKEENDSVSEEVQRAVASLRPVETNAMGGKSNESESLDEVKKVVGSLRPVETKERNETTANSAEDEVRRAVQGLRHVNTKEGNDSDRKEDDSTADEVQRAVKGLRHVDPNETSNQKPMDTTTADEVKRASQSLKPVGASSREPSATDAAANPASSLRHVDPTDLGEGKNNFEITKEEERPRAAKLTATKTREMMDQIVTEEIREWVALMVGKKYNEKVLESENFCDAIADGIVLNVLLQKMRKPPVPDEELVVPKRATGFFMRDNVNKFLIEAKKTYNLLDAQIFIESDLCDKNNERQVITCLMSIARIAYNRGDIPVAPSIIMYEKEIDTSAKKLDEEELERLVEEAENNDDEFEECVEAPSDGEEEEQHEEKKREPETEEAKKTVVTTQDEKETPAVETTVPEKNEEEEEEGKKEEETKAEKEKEETLSDPTTTAEVSKETATKKEGDAEKGVFYVRDGQLGVKVDGEIKKRPVFIRKRMPAGLSDSATPQYYARHWDGIDVAVGAAVNEHYKSYPQSTWRLRGIASSAGEYVLYSRGGGHKRQLFIRIIQRQPFVRKSQGPGGPSWVQLSERQGKMSQIVLDATSNAKTRYAVLLVHAGGPKDLHYASLWGYLENQFCQRRSMDLMPMLLWRAILYTAVLPWSLKREQSVQRKSWVQGAAGALSPRRSIHQGGGDSVENNDSELQVGSSLSVYFCTLLAAKIESALRKSVVERIKRDMESEGDTASEESIQQIVAVDVRCAYMFQSDSINETLKDFHFLGNYAGVVDTNGDACIVEEEKLIVLPLYPQYSSLYTGVAWDTLINSAYFRENRTVPHLEFIRSICRDPLYLRATELHLRRFFQENGTPDTLFVAFSGIPRRFVASGDCYQLECIRTFHALRNILSSPLVLDTNDPASGESSSFYTEGLPESCLFYSFLPYGLESSLEPRIEKVGASIARGTNGSPVSSEPNVERKNLGVAYIVTPGMIIEEVKQVNMITGRLTAYLHKLGWEKVDFIPCLNDSEENVSFMTDLLTNHILQ